MTNELRICLYKREPHRITDQNQGPAVCFDLLEPFDLEASAMVVEILCGLRDHVFVADENGGYLDFRDDPLSPRATGVGSLPDLVAQLNPWLADGARQRVLVSPAPWALNFEVRKEDAELIVERLLAQVARENDAVTIRMPAGCGELSIPSRRALSPPPPARPLGAGTQQTIDSAELYDEYCSATGQPAYAVAKWGGEDVIKVDKRALRKVALHRMESEDED